MAQNPGTSYSISGITVSPPMLMETSIESETPFALAARTSTTPSCTAVRTPSTSIVAASVASPVAASATDQVSSAPASAGTVSAESCIVSPAACRMSCGAEILTDSAAAPWPSETVMSTRLLSKTLPSVATMLAYTCTWPGATASTVPPAPSTRTTDSSVLIYWTLQSFKRNCLIESSFKRTSSSSKWISDVSISLTLARVFRPSP